nr:hypothetical protein [Tanacetum cinerariifolium]
MNLVNEECLNCVYGDGKPLTCNKCEGMLRGGFCFPCNLEAENPFICDQDAYSFDYTSNNSNHFPQPQYENYLCNLYGNNSHDDYDCQQRFLFIYEQEPSYNQNYDDNYYPHDLPSFPCCDNCGGSHETFQCQPMDKNIDFFENSSNTNQEKEGLPQDSDIHQLIEECSTEICEEQKQSMEYTMLELVKIFQEKELLCIHDNVEDLIESALNSKLPSINSQRLEKEQQEVKNVVEQPAERGNRSIQSLQNFRVIHKNSISLNNTSQISSIHAIAPILSTKEPENPLSIGYEHLSITPKTESDEVTESNAKNLLPIPSECEVTLEDKRDCDVPLSTIDVCNDHSEIFSDSKIDDDILVYDDDFEDIEYIEASFFDPEIVNVEEENGVEEENVVQYDVEEEEVDLEDISQIQDVVLREKLLSITRLIANIESLNDNPTSDRVLNSFEFDNSLSDNFSPEFETFCDNTEETRSGNTTHANDFLPEYDSFCFEIEPDQERRCPILEDLLIDDSILSHESSDSNFKDNPSIPRPPLESPYAETDA